MSESAFYSFLIGLFTATILFYTIDRHVWPIRRVLAMTSFAGGCEVWSMRQLSQLSLCFGS